MKTVICPGSFDPVTNGHLDIISRSSALFDKVIVVVMKNPSKTNFCFTPEERADLIRRCIKDYPNVLVDTYEGLLAEYAKEKGAVAVVKGLRAVSDFEYEFQQAQMNKKLNENLETVFINTRVENLYLSSSAVKQICELGGDISDFVPHEIRDDIVKRIKRGVSK
ncbi:MAG: pantetheine-phosphate adenylyltransferase [Clostridia bacterium]|nr:pantetheine-phosphate adenylyltransferase [Clostridia bacterium]MBR5545267.1 pantetheine-phosphate adenylyltransferase [Clostridia bacterium]